MLRVKSQICHCPYLHIRLHIYRVLFNGFVFSFAFLADCGEVPQQTFLAAGVAAGESDGLLQHTAAEHAAPGVRAAANLAGVQAVVLQQILHQELDIFHGKIRHELAADTQDGNGFSEPSLITKRLGVICGRKDELVLGHNYSNCYKFCNFDIFKFHSLHKKKKLHSLRLSRRTKVS